MLVKLGIAFFIWWIFSDNYFKEFDPWSYWKIMAPSAWSFVAVSWPILLYGVAHGQLDWLSNDQGEEKSMVSDNLGMKGLYSLLAGVLEELYHRGVGIYVGLLIVSAGNELLYWFLAGLMLYLLVQGIKLMKSPHIAPFVMIGLLFVGGYVWYLAYTNLGPQPLNTINRFLLSIYTWIASSPTHILLVIGPMFIVFTILPFFTRKLLSKYFEMKLPEFHLTGRWIAHQILRLVLITIFALYALPLGIKAIANPIILPANADATIAIVYIGALIWSNASFRRGHAYQGLGGMYSSYIFGFLMFHIAFSYGLFYAILLHFLYDIVLLTSEHIVQVIKNHRLAERQFA